MQKKLILFLAFMVLVAIFALQNSVEVEIKLWFWSLRTSMVLVLILTFAAGAVAGILVSRPKKPGKPEPEKSPPSGPGPAEVPLEVTPADREDEFEDVRH